MRNSPVIIAGCGRSGTTYLKSLLDAHPDIFIPSESLYIIDYLKARNTLLNPLLKWLYWKEPQLQSWYRGSKFKFASFQEAVEKTHLLEMESERKSIWGQKTPRFIRHKKILDRAFPSAKWILIHRDPRSVAASMLESRTHFYSLYFACKRWNLDNSFLDIIQNDSNTITLAYEDLIQFPERELNKVFNFLDIKGYALDFLIDQAKDRGYKGSKFKNLSIKQGFHPDKNKINNWNKRLTADQINIIEYYTCSCMKKLGYQPVNKHPVKPKITKGISLKDILIFFEYLYKWPRYLLVTLLRKIIISARI